MSRLTRSAAAIAALAVPLAFSTAAGASPRAVPVLTVSNGTGGYYVTGLPVSSAEVRITPLPGLGRAGEQACDERTGWGLQVGLAAEGGTFTVEYAVGRLGAGKCTGDGMLAAGARPLTPALAGIPAGTEVFAYLSYSVYRQVTGTKASGRGKVFGEAVFAAMSQAGCGCDVWTLTIRGLPADAGMTSDGIAVQQETAAPEAGQVAGFAYADTNPGGFFGMGPLFGTEGTLAEVVTATPAVTVTPGPVAIVEANGDTSFGVSEVPSPAAAKARARLAALARNMPRPGPVLRPVPQSA